MRSGLRSGRRTNVCFHGVGTPGRALEPGEDRYWLSRDDFRRILDEVVVAGSDVSLSIDDSNASDVDIVLPALLERGLRATFFVVVDRLDAPGSLSRSDACELVRAGMTLGNHGWTHVPWTNFRGADLEREVLEARAALSVIAGEEIRTAAVPQGRYNRDVLVAARAAGYVTLFTSDRQSAAADAWLQARFSVQRGTTPEALRTIVRDAGRVPRRAYSAMNRFRKSRV